MGWRQYVPGKEEEMSRPSDESMFGVLSEAATSCWSGEMIEDNSGSKGQIKQDLVGFGKDLGFTLSKMQSHWRYWMT